MIYLLIFFTIFCTIWSQILYGSLLKEFNERAASWVNFKDLLKMGQLKKDNNFMERVKLCKKIHVIRLLLFYGLISYILLALF